MYKINHLSLFLLNTWSTPESIWIFWASVKCTTITCCKHILCTCHAVPSSYQHIDAFLSDESRFRSNSIITSPSIIYLYFNAGVFTIIIAYNAVQRAQYFSICVTFISYLIAHWTTKELSSQSSLLGPEKRRNKLVMTNEKRIETIVKRDI